MYLRQVKPFRAFPRALDALRDAMASPERASDRWLARHLFCKSSYHLDGFPSESTEVGGPNRRTANEPVLASLRICFVISRWLPTTVILLGRTHPGHFVSETRSARVGAHGLHECSIPAAFSPSPKG